MTQRPDDASVPPTGGDSRPADAPLPPPGSRGYRGQGDPLPRGVPLAGAPRSSSKSAASPKPASPAGPSHPHVVDSPKVPPAAVAPSQPPSDSTGSLPFENVTGETAASSQLPPVEPPAPKGDAAESGAIPPAVDRRSLVMFVVILLSVALHLALGWTLYDRPLGHIDPTLIGQETQFFRIQRSPRDIILEPGESLIPRAGSNLPDPQQRNAQSPLTDLSLSLLGAQASAHASQTNQPDLAAQPRPFEDNRPDSPELELTATTPPVQMPQSIQQQMLVDIPLPTPFVGQSGTNPTATGGSGEASDLPAGGEGSGHGQAASMLAQVGRVGVQANPQPPSLNAPVLTDKPQLPEQRPVTGNLLPGPIDLSSITAQAATQLSIPEHLDNDFEYVVTRYLPKGGWGTTRDEQRGYFRVDITAKRSLRKLQTMPKDLVFLIDISGSVSQDWVDNALRGVRDSLGSLNPGDRFNIVYFTDKPAILSNDGILPVNEENLAKARAFLASAQSGGMTDVNQALSRLLVRDVAMNRTYGLVLISDGRPTRGVMDTRELINLITRDNDLAASIYCVGIGRIQNRTLLEFLAYRNKGFCVYVDEPLQTAISVRDLISRLRYPIMKDIRLSTLGLNVDEVFPVDLPNIHQGETFSIFGRFDNPGKPFTMRLIGHNGQQTFDFTFTRDLFDAPIGDQQISRDWAFWKLHHLYNLMIRQGDTRELRQEIEYLRRRYKLETLYRN